MHSLLPNLAPRDSHTIWYTSRRRPPGSPPPTTTPQAPPGEHPQPHPHRSRSHVLYMRYSEHRLADQQEGENEMHRLVTANFGSTWLKPPGVTKTLHQLREEKREQEEHAEALRREQLAQELAEAEAEEVGREGEGEDFMEMEEGEDGGRDLDEDVPEGDDAMGWDEERSSTVPEEDGEEEEEGEGTGVRDELVARINDEAYREAMARGNADLGEDFDGSDDLDEEGQGAMLDEEDFVGADGGDLDMDANLDDDIPDADESGLGGYEHTDSEAELSSSEEEDDDDADAGYASRAQALALAPPQSPTLRARGQVRDEPRTSMDLSSILSRDESSFMESSPGMRGSQARRP